MYVYKETIYVSQFRSTPGMFFLVVYSEGNSNKVLQ